MGDAREKRRRKAESCYERRRNRELASESMMDELVNVNKDTICYILGWIYRNTDNPKIKDEARLAVTMAKAMGQRLKEYRRLRKKNES